MNEKMKEKRFHSFVGQNIEFVALGYTIKALKELIETFASN